MAKQLQLTIPTPCHENWDAMTAADKGKFCSSCQKQVVDFSNMSDRQLAEFFKKPLSLSKGGSVCGRFMSDQLGRSIEIPKKRTPWVKYFFQFVLLAFLVSIKASAQRTQTKPKINNVTNINKTNNQLPMIMGDVDISKCSKPLMGDTVVMEEIVVIAKTTQTNTKDPYNSGLAVVSSQLANKLEGKVSGPVITVIGDKEPDITANRDFSKPTLAPDLSLQGSVGEVVIVGAISVKRTRNKKNKNTPLLEKIFKDTASKFFKVFPNPVTSGSNLTIELKKTEEGYYTLQLLNQSGQSVHQQEIWIDAEARLLNLNIPQVSAGSYFIVMINKKSGKKFTEKIIIQ